MLKEIQRLVIFLLFAIALVLPFPAEQAQAVSLAQKDQKEKKEKKPSQPGKPILWRDPGAVEKLDLIGGSTGRAKAPKPPFTFVEESLSGSNPKIRVTDANGVTWTAKFGSEVNAETFPTRMERSSWKPAGERRRAAIPTGIERTGGIGLAASTSG